MERQVPESSLVDRFGRKVSYLRMSVTDRCDFRCVYCMEEEMTFVPRAQILSFEELQTIAEAFVSLGVRKIRLTGGEPLVRSDIQELCTGISQLEGLDELVMTTNGSQLPRLADELRQAGVKRLNISLDSLQPERFKELTRTGKLSVVLEGIDAAIRAGFEKIKLNSVVLKGRNDDEIPTLVEFALSKNLDISFIEEMPLGIIHEHERKETFLPSSAIREEIESRWHLTEAEGSQLDGPSRYYAVRGSSSRIGFISPHSDNFCASCNRVRLTAEGRLLLCLGNEHSVDLRRVLREHPGDLETLKRHIVQALELKPEKHHFDLEQAPEILRFMSATGG